MSEFLTKPFKGILYNRKKIDNIASCVCPPYDVVSSVRTYYERDPFNAIRLELPMSQPSMDKYNVARHTMEQWLRTGVLQKDTSDTIYVYDQEVIVDEIHYLRRGFIALNRLQKERILTHEQTRKKAKEDRERLIGMLKTYTSLVFALYEDKEEAIEDILISSQKEKLYDFIDEQSITNRFYRMTDPGEMERLASLMESKEPLHCRWPSQAGSFIQAWSGLYSSLPDEHVFNWDRDIPLPQDYQIQQTQEPRGIIVPSRRVCCHREISPYRHRLGKKCCSHDQCSPKTLVHHVFQR